MIFTAAALTEYQYSLSHLFRKKNNHWAGLWDGTDIRHRTSGVSSISAFPRNVDPEGSSRSLRRPTIGVERHTNGTASRSPLRVVCGRGSTGKSKSNIGATVLGSHTPATLACPRTFIAAYPASMRRPGAYPELVRAARRSQVFSQSSQWRCFQKLIVHPPEYHGASFVFLALASDTPTTRRVRG